MKMVNKEIYDKLVAITEEERAILSGDGSIQRQLYMDGNADVINSDKLLSPGKLIAIRPHTRFVHFPPHSHDYIEMVYMISGNTVHIVNGNKVRIPKKYKKELYKELYYCAKFGVQGHLDKISCTKAFYKEHVYGKIYFVNMVEPEEAKKLFELADKVQWEY